MRHAYPQYAARLDNANEPKTASQLVSLQPEPHLHHSRLACSKGVVPAHRYACKVWVTILCVLYLLHASSLIQSLGRKPCVLNRYVGVWHAARQEES